MAAKCGELAAAARTGQREVFGPHCVAYNDRAILDQDDIKYPLPHSQNTLAAWPLFTEFHIQLTVCAPAQGVART
jgi:hypothetical protein